MSNKRVIVTKESSTSRNIEFRDTVTGEDMTRAQFVKKINQGNYPDYYTRKINGVITPVSKPNKSVQDNLG